MLASAPSEMASPTLGSLLVIAATALLIYLVNLVWSRRNLPPGPWGWPVIGSMHLLGPRPHQSLQKLAAKYGPLMSLRIWQKLFIVASSAEAAKEFLKLQDANFSSRPFKRAFQVLMPNDIAFVEGNTPLRRHLRKIFQLELTSAKRIQETEHVRAGEISKMIRALPENCVVTIRLYLEVMVTNVLSLMVFKKQYLAVAGKDGSTSSTADEIKEVDAFTRILSDIAKNISQNNVGDVVPALRWLDPQGLESQYRQVKARMDSFSLKIIAEHLVRRRHGDRQDGVQEKDLIDVFLDQVEEEKRHEVTLENVQSILWNAIAAGLAPIVATSEWALTETQLAHPGESTSRARRRRRQVRQSTRVPPPQAEVPPSNRQGGFPTAPRTHASTAREHGPMQSFRIRDSSQNGPVLQLLRHPARPSCLAQAPGFRPIQVSRRIPDCQHLPEWTASF